MSERMNGRCHCGAVRVSVPADAIGVVACHCQDCQKLHGNFFAMLAVDRDQVEWSGEEAHWYASSDRARRSFCRNCGSRLAKDPAGSPKVLVSVGLFEPELQRRIIREVFVESKPAWYA